MGRRADTVESLSGEIVALQAERASLQENNSLPTSVVALRKECEERKVYLKNLKIQIHEEAEKNEAEYLIKREEAAEKLLIVLRDVEENIVQARKEKFELQSDINSLIGEQLVFDKEFKGRREAAKKEEEAIKKYYADRKLFFEQEQKELRGWEHTLNSKAIKLNENKTHMQSVKDTLSKEKAEFCFYHIAKNKSIENKEQTLKSEREIFEKKKNDSQIIIQKRENTLLCSELKNQKDIATIKARFQSLDTKKKLLDIQAEDLDKREIDLKVNNEIYKEMKLRIESEKRRIKNKIKEHAWDK